MTKTSRRAVLAGLTGSLIPPALCLPANANPSEVNVTNPGYYQFSVGDISVTAISDGQIAFPAWPTYAPNADEDAVYASMAEHGRTPPDYLLDATVLLLQSEGRNILVDTGWGAFAPQVGQTSKRLNSMGVTEDDIDLIILSHIHPDHVGGLRLESGDAAFANADVVISNLELTQWKDGPDFGDMLVDDGFKPVFANAAQLVLSLGSRLKTASPDEEIAPGISLMDLKGHTAGHSGVRIASGEAELFYVADLFHDPAFDLANPGWRTAFDFAPTQAEDTRRGLLDRASADNSALIAYHMPFPGVGQIAKTPNGYNWRPAPWVI